MTLDAKLKSIIAGSPAAIPALGGRIYGQSAPQGVTKPYCVYQVIGAIPIELQDNAETESTNRWLLQFSIWHTDRTVKNAIARALRTLLLSVREGGAGAGVMGFRFINAHDEELEVERLFGTVLEFEVWENL